MIPGTLVQHVLRAMDRLAVRSEESGLPEYQRVGRRGEEDAYFYLRRNGYVMVARNFRTPLHRGEIDLIGWKKDVLCFIELKSRTSREVKPAEAAVDRDKQRELTRVARDYLRHLPGDPQWRFDILSVYYENNSYPSFELYENAFPVS